MLIRVFSVLLVLAHAGDLTLEKTLSGIPYRTGTQVPTGVRRIEYVSVTVDDLPLAKKFYGGVLGGVEVEFCTGQSQYCTQDGAVRFSGDSFKNAMFGTDIAAGTPTPPIGDNGTHEVHSVWYILGNALIQSVKFVDKQSGAVFNLREPLTSPVWMAKAHIDLWVKDGVDGNRFIYDVETQSHAQGAKDVKFNRPVPQETRQDRNSVPMSKYINKVIGSPFDGLSWAYFKGPIGEQLEIYKITRTIKQGIGRAYCDRGAVSSAFMPDSDRVSNGTLSDQLFGLFQWGYRTGDLNRAVGFYTEVLGGNLITYPTQGIEIMRDDSAHWMLLANETIESYEYAAETNVPRATAMRHFAVANLSSTGFDRLDHRFILFDNFVVEPLKYTNGLTFGGDGYDPKLNHTASPAYVGTIVGAFGLDRGQSVQSYLPGFKKRLETQGFRDVQPPAEVAVFPAGHPYGGLELGYAKGVDGETFAIVQVGEGSFMSTLKPAMIQAGAVSTLFNETNIYKQGKMKEFCAYADQVTNGAAVEIKSVGDSLTPSGSGDTCDNASDGIPKDLTVAAVVLAALNFAVLLCAVCYLFNSRRNVTPVEANSDVNMQGYNAMS
eukprot:jgi/Bigna1/75860/fgenesh1_pg.37_\